MGDGLRRVWIVVLLNCIVLACGVTDPNDLNILIDFKNGLENPELLKWPDKGDDPCGEPLWPHIFCANGSVTQIQVQNLGLKGPLPQNFNSLKKLYNIGLQRNHFNGKLPTFRGLSELQYAYLDYNEFDTIPSDFFVGLSSLLVLALDYNPLNQTTGWSIPSELGDSAQLTNLSMMNCNMVGPVPDFLGKLSSLNALKLSYNRLSGDIPESFGQSLMQILWLNDQDGGGMSGPIDVIANMSSLTQLWLHGNQFTGTIPVNIGALSSLKDLNLNKNQLVGLIPQSLADMELDSLDLNNNHLMGPIPKFKAGVVSYDSNSFCQLKPGVSCSPEATSLLDFLGGMNYPLNLASQWSGNDPCEGPWLGVSCNSKLEVSSINLPRYNLSGRLSPSIGELLSLVEIRLGENNVSGTVPQNLTELNSLRLLDLSSNNLEPPLPTFQESVKVLIEGNPLFVSNRTLAPPSSARGTPSDSPSLQPTKLRNNSSKKFKLVIAGVIAIGAIIVLIVIFLCIYLPKKRKEPSKASSSIVVHPKDPSDPENLVKVAISDNTTGSLFTQTTTSIGSDSSNATESSYMIEAGNLVISVQVLRKVTNNFSPENEVGRGGFGTVYKGEMESGIQIAVKRMEASPTSSKASDEFQAEIAALSKVRHRHLVSLFGYSIEGNERLLVYEYMPQGALSRHLFHWKTLKLQPLPWTTRLTIALDVARAMEYLHSLARQTFIHRDLKSSNILLDDKFRAKVSDFGLVKLAPDGQRSVVTRLAGTFGYLAPEYAVMGKITTKADVYSYGVVLMELLTGLTALDERRSEESRHLAEWFWRIRSSKEKLKAAIDPPLDTTEETLESISIIAELAGHCTAREPNHRPDMCHAVNVLSPLVEEWKPTVDESDNSFGNDSSPPLLQMLKAWKESESSTVSYNSLSDNSKGSIPERPAGLADSFNSADAR
ncbi:Leucine-rich repeat protein kinase family protein [Tripterygium wilfordii]|uniref:non-specific serine/threonine protein kinase n=1 Tax=Tripterygium wilfordii TaxID=458696 RepID=A0A7J7DZ75_TRIWF|nr:receptor protein kinase TMK1-like [Tripterygium wilfordii]KAF5751690.1 Leucine-rich repeat protein kinase family protein [Tripterygium wilfordii]